MKATATNRNDSGWIPFTGVLLLFIGAFNVIDGIVAISKDDLFKADELLFGDLTMWGWIWLVLGVLQIFTSSLVFKRRMPGMILAVSWAFLAGMGHMLAVGAYPIWSLTMVAMCFLVMFGLLTNSDQFE